MRVMTAVAICASLSACFSVGLAGCQSAPAPRADEAAAGAISAASAGENPTENVDPLGQVPDDMVLDVTVLPGRNAGDPAGAQQVQSRYILFPDGSLRGDSGPSVGVLTRPAPVRMVTREQMADAWFVARQCGFGDPAAAPFDGNPALLAPSPTEILTIVTVRRDGRYGTFLERVPAGGGATDITPSGRLVRALARLAWASDEPPAETVVLPLRYDLGADPYSRYRPIAKPVANPAAKKAPVATPVVPKP